MKLQRRVVDLGSGYGKVVRYFPIIEPRPPITSLSEAFQLYCWCSISEHELKDFLKERGYPTDHADMLFYFAQLRKEGRLR